MRPWKHASGGASKRCNVQAITSKHTIHGYKGQELGTRRPASVLSFSEYYFLPFQILLDRYPTLDLNRVRCTPPTNNMHLGIPSLALLLASTVLAAPFPAVNPAGKIPGKLKPLSPFSYVSILTNACSRCCRTLQLSKDSW